MVGGSCSRSAAWLCWRGVGVHLVLLCAYCVRVVGAVVWYRVRLLPLVACPVCRPDLLRLLPSDLIQIIITPGFINALLSLVMSCIKPSLSGVVAPFGCSLLKYRLNAG